VGYYVGQVGNDTSSAFYNYAINANRFNLWAVGGLVGYNFGPAQLNVWGVDEFSADASGGTPVAGIAKGAIAQGFKLYASVSYKLWAPELKPVFSTAETWTNTSLPPPPSGWMKP
jgi:hypothetical protein